MSLKRLIYVSTIRDKSLTSLSEIIIESIENNIELNITGILIRTDNYYIQAIEGSTTNINKLFTRISEDNRHSDIKVKVESTTEKRIFKDWPMKAFFYDSFAVNLKKIITEDFGLIGEQIAQLDNSKNLLDLLQFIYNYFTNTDKEEI